MSEIIQDGPAGTSRCFATATTMPAVTMRRSKSTRLTEYPTVNSASPGLNAEAT